MGAKKSDADPVKLAATRSGKTGKYKDHSGDWKTDYVPHAMYFYYRKDGKVRVYLWVTPDNRPITEADREPLIVHLTKNARQANGGTDPRPIGWKFEDVPWWRRSYLVAAVDTQGYKFPQDDAVIIDRDDNGSKYRNHCFFDGGEGEVAIPAADGGPIQVMWTINYMKNRSGDDIPPGKAHNFNFYFQKYGRDIRRRDDEEDHGTNMGPPLGVP